jgi:hypothetical protein
MYTHSHEHRPQPPDLGADQSRGQQRERVVERARRGTLRWLRGIEEAHSLQRAQPVVVQGEPQVMVTIDQDASRPQTGRAAAKPRPEDGGGRCRERHVIS